MRLELHTPLVSGVEALLRTTSTAEVALLVGRAILLLLEVFAPPDAIFRKDHIDGQFEHVFYHAGQQTLEELARFLQARVRIDLDQPGVEVFVEDEVVAEELEAVFAAVGIQRAPHRVKSLEDDLMHLRHEVVVDGDAAVRVEVVNVLLECRKAQLVTVFEVTIIFSMLLDSIIGKVHESVVDILQVDPELRR